MLLGINLDRLTVWAPDRIIDTSTTHLGAHNDSSNRPRNPRLHGHTAEPQGTDRHSQHRATNEGSQGTGSNHQDQRIPVPRGSQLRQHQDSDRGTCIGRQAS